MDLKALTTALIVAFLTVIVDAVFHFHYIYVIVILAVLCYAFVQAMTRHTVFTRPGDKAACPLATLLPDGSEDLPDVRVICRETACRNAIQDLLHHLPGPAHRSVTIERGPNNGWVHLIWSVNRKLRPIPASVQQALHVLGDHGPVWVTDIPRKTEFHLLVPRA